MVSDRGTVFLIDCDSFQVTANGKLFPCEVGVAHFTPPELQGRSFGGVPQTSNHDLFGLAVLIFHLLCMGRHPYAGRFLGSGDLPIEKAITEFRYAYSRAATTLQMAPPPQTLNLRLVMPKAADLFERAFTKGSESRTARPTADEWYDVLHELRSSLKGCSNDMGHMYPNSLASCPWCDLVKTGAPNFFISVLATKVATGTITLTFDVRTLWTQIESVNPPIQLNTSQLPSTSRFHVVATELPEEMRQFIGLGQLIGQITIGSLLGCVSYFVSQLLALGCAASFLVFGVWWLVLQFTSGIRSEKKRRERRLKLAQRTVRQLIHEVTSKLKQLSLQYYETRAASADAVQMVGELKPQYAAELNLLRNHRERSQRDAFLQSIFISDYKIEKIGTGRLSVLSSYGIETAYDLQANQILGIGGFGPAITSNLMEWKWWIESKFRFDPNQAISPSELQAVVTKYVQLSQHHESTLKNGLVRLKAIRQDSVNVVGSYQKQLTEATRALAQAEVDVTVFR